MGGRSAGYPRAVRSDELPLSHSVVDRAAHLRDDEGLARALEATSTRALLVRGGEVLVGPDDALVLLPVDAAATVGPTTTADDDQAWVLLGAEPAGDGDVVHVARRLGARTPPPATGVPSDTLVHRPSPAPDVDAEPPAVAPSGARWAPLRTVGAVLAPRDAGLATTAVALDAWHERHPRCPRCGGPTRVTHAGWVRRCTVDDSEHYPRTDPAVIMAVVDGDDRLLLGHGAQWAAGRYSTLAGFVEPGESLEHAVRREVAEEVGVLVGEVVYRGSQPWPFPASLMVGFWARALSTELHADGAEVTHARWVSRDELRTALVAGDVVAPGRASIARALIEDWFGGPLPEPADPALAWA